MNVDFVPFIRGVRGLRKPRLIFSRINGPIISAVAVKNILPGPQNIIYICVCTKEITHIVPVLRYGHGIVSWAVNGIKQLDS